MCPHVTELVWTVPCDVISRLGDFIKVLQHNVDGGRIQVIQIDRKIEREKE